MIQLDIPTITPPRTAQLYTLTLPCRELRPGQHPPFVIQTSPPFVIQTSRYSGSALQGSATTSAHGTTMQANGPYQNRSMYPGAVYQTSTQTNIQQAFNAIKSTVYYEVLNTIAVYNNPREDSMLVILKYTNGDPWLYFCLNAPPSKHNMYYKNNMDSYYSTLTKEQENVLDILENSKPTVATIMSQLTMLKMNKLSESHVISIWNPTDYRISVYLNQNDMINMAVMHFPRILALSKQLKLDV